MARQTKRQRTQQDLQGLLQQRDPAFSSFHVDEPDLLCGVGERAPEPKLGLRLFGPCLEREEDSKRQLRVGFVGTGEAIDQAEQWLVRCRSEVRPDSTDIDPFLFPSFPGLEAAFNCEPITPNSLVEELTPRDIKACEKLDRDQAVEHLTRTLSQRLSVLRDRPRPPDIAIVTLPTSLREKVGSGRARPKRGRRGQPRRQLTLSFLDERRPEDASRTLHRALKCEGMRHQVPTQMAWPTTFIGGKGVQDAATRAWNFCTGLYYKAGGLPWRADGLAPGTCYIGISFFRSIYDASSLHTSMAQAFSDRGEGFVLRGGSFDWNPRKGSPELPRELARSLIAGVIDQYKLHHRQPPTRVVVHKSSAFTSREMDAMEDAMPDVPFADFLAIRRSSIRFLRIGKEPPLRGTAIEIDRGRYVVYTRGYVPYLRLYPGLRIPRPLDIHHSRGSSSIRRLLTELFALTRMNWNSADFASAEPITLAFSRKIGLILSELPDDVEPERYFRFYM